MSQYIYRLQDARGRGAYSAVRLCDGEHGYYDSCDGFPLPNHDGLGSLPSGSRWLFGFRDLLQARRWFASYPDLKMWSEEGLKLAIYRRTSLEAVRYGEKQAIFIPNPGVTPFMLECTALQEYREHDLEVLADQHWDQLEAASKPVDAMPDWISDAVMKVAEPIAKAQDDYIIEEIRKTARQVTGANLREQAQSSMMTRYLSDLTIAEERAMAFYGDGWMRSSPPKAIDWPSFYGAKPDIKRGKYTPVNMKGVPPGDSRLTRDAYLDNIRIR